MAGNPASAREPGTWSSAKNIAALAADSLTASRFVVGLYLIALGLEGGGAANLEAAVQSFVLGWTTDVVDGWLARSTHAGSTRWGSYDFAADMFMTWAMFAYFVLSGLLPTWCGVLYGALAVILATLKPEKAVMMALAAPVDILAVAYAFRASFETGLAFVGWIALALAVDFGRFRQVVTEFVDGLGAREVVRRWPVVRRLLDEHGGTGRAVTLSYENGMYSGRRRRPGG